MYCRALTGTAADPKETFLGAHTSYVSNWVRSGQVREVLFNRLRAFRWAEVMVCCCVAWSRGPMPNQVACCVVGLWGRSKNGLKIDQKMKGF